MRNIQLCDRVEYDWVHSIAHGHSVSYFSEHITFNILIWDKCKI